MEKKYSFVYNRRKNADTKYFDLQNVSWDLSKPTFVEEKLLWLKNNLTLCSLLWHLLINDDNVSAYFGNDDVWNECSLLTL